jgi:hypothetical protein
MVELNLTNFITIGLIVVLFLMVWRFIARSTGLPQVV